MLYRGRGPAWIAGVVSSNATSSAIPTGFDPARPSTRWLLTVLLATTTMFGTSEFAIAASAKSSRGAAAAAPSASDEQLRYFQCMDQRLRVLEEQLKARSAAPPAGGEAAPPAGAEPPKPFPTR